MIRVIAGLRSGNPWGRDAARKRGSGPRMTGSGACAREHALRLCEVRAVDHDAADGDDAGAGVLGKGFDDGLRYRRCVHRAK